MTISVAIPPPAPTDLSGSRAGNPLREIAHWLLRFLPHYPDPVHADPGRTGGIPVARSANGRR